MTLGGERGSVQNPFIDYAESAKWEYVPKDQATALRGGTPGILFKDLFIDQIIRLNEPFMTRELATELAKRIGRIPLTIEGNLIAWEYLIGIKTIFVPAEKRERDVRFIDTDDIENNTFHITDEFSFTNGSKTIREDAVFLINGIPVFFVGTKAAHKKEGIAEARDQIRRYHRHRTAPVKTSVRGPHLRKDQQTGYGPKENTPGTLSPSASSTLQSRSPASTTLRLRGPACGPLLV